MNMLVVHPQDPTTDFLKAVYKDTTFTIINTEMLEAEINLKLETHERIIFLGHGSADGLFGWGRMAFHAGMLNNLKRSSENIFVWCYASEFCSKYKLGGLQTEMFISEELEAQLYSIECPVEDIENSNILFANLLNSVLLKGLSSSDIYNYMIENYISQESEIIEFNANRLYYN